MRNYFDLTQPTLTIGGLSAEALAAKYGTPLYVYDAEIFKIKYETLRRALPSSVEIFFAMKSNPSLAVVTLLSNLGAGVDIASLGELYTALRAGVPPHKILFTGPAKQDRELDAAVRADIFAINVESEGELERLNSIARARNKRFSAGMRLNAAFAPDERTTIIGGASPQKFGIDPSRALETIRLAQRLSHVKLVGIHIFNASQVLDAQAWLHNAEQTVRTAFELWRATNFDLHYVDLGGGLGVPYADGETELDVAALGSGLARILAQYTAKGLPEGLRVLIEPGRYLTAEAGVYLTRVVDVKESRGVRYALVDGGVHHLLRPTLFATEHPVRIAQKLTRLAQERYSIAGPLCTALDYLAKDVMLPPVEVGNLVAIFNVGAYGWTESMPYFLSHPTPPEVLVLHGKDYLIRPRQTPEEYLANQIVPDVLTQKRFTRDSS
jgi:diaminopimelate decarboxylase